MLKFLKLVDSFPQIDHLTIIHSESHAKSAFGGIITIIIYVLSFSFFVYSINDWQQNNKLPKIIQSTKNSENLSYYQTDVLAQFAFLNNDDNLIDPFDPENIVIQAVYQIWKDYEMLYQGQVPYSQQKSKTNSYLHILQNVSFQYTSNESSFISLDYQILFIDCKEELLNSGQKCANQTIVDQFYSQAQRWIIITFFEEQFNTKTKAIEKIPKRNSVYIQRNKTFYQDSILQIASSYIDNGFLFSSVNHQQFLYSVTNDMLEIPKSFSIQTLNFDTTFIWYIELGQLYIEQFVEYPKIQEILADIGSIVSIFWFLQYFPQLYNKIQLKRYSLNEIIKIYYPDFDDLKIQSNIFGQITDISYKGVNQYGQKFEIWKKAYLNLLQAANSKTSFLNIQYEVSRLQLLLMHQLSQNLSSKEMKLSLYVQEISNILDPQMSWIQQPQNESINVLSSDENLLGNRNNDFGIFSYQFKDKENRVNSNTINVA